MLIASEKESGGLMKVDFISPPVQISGDFAKAVLAHQTAHEGIANALVTSFHVTGKAFFVVGLS
jgi:hypothetical protein